MKSTILDIIDKKIKEKSEFYGSHEYTDGLQELRQEIENLDEWINVKEILPMNATFVLVCSPEGIVNKAFAQIMSHGYYFIRDGENLNVTHWQPLPPPPSNN